MISYKRDVLERQSLSDVNMGSGFQSLKECVKRPLLDACGLRALRRHSSA